MWKRGSIHITLINPIYNHFYDKNAKCKTRDFTHVIFRYIAGLYPNAPFETRNRVKGCSERIKTSSFDVPYMHQFMIAAENLQAYKLIFVCMRSPFQCDFITKLRGGFICTSPSWLSVTSASSQCC